MYMYCTHVYNYHSVLTCISSDPTANPGASPDLFPSEDMRAISGCVPPCSNNSRPAEECLISFCAAKK